MRPICLTMTAFGSYGAKTDVEFDKLRGGLYLIVGKTGAGKTTIFDAISFALFGVPSGTERTADMMHSDFVSKAVDTEVELRFSHQGQEYRVQRSLHYPRVRGTKDTYGKSSPSATLWEPGRRPLSGAGSVTARCEELLGLNAEQFRRIVMLAQGEFRKFLDAKGDERNVILGRLFDNTEYLRFQNLLGGTRDELNRRRRSAEEQLRLVMGALRLPEGEDPEAYYPDNTGSIDNLAALIGRDEAALAALREQSAAAEAAVSELTRQEGAAEAVNRQLAELARLRQQREDLLARGPAAEAAQTAWLAAERALHRVRPKTEALGRARTALSQGRTQLARQEAELAQAEERLSAAREALKAAEPLRRKLEERSLALTKLEEAMPRYETLRQKEAARAAAQAELDAVLNRLEKAEAERQRTALRLEAVRPQLEGLEDAEAEAVRLAGELQKAQERRDALSAPRTGIRARFEALSREERALQRDKAEQRRLTEAALSAEEAYHGLYRAFLQGQAGSMGAELERELQERGKAVCPVCHSVFCRDEAHDFARPRAETPAEQDVEAAEAAWKQAEDRRRRKLAERDKALALLKERRELLLHDAAALSPALGDWDALCAPSALPALAARLQTASAEAEEAHAAALRRQARRKTLLAEEKTLREKSNTLDAALSADKQRREETSGRLAAVSAETEALRGQLPFPTVEEALAQRTALTKERDGLSRSLGAAEEAQQKAQGERDRTQGVVTSLREALPALEQGQAEASAAEEAALQEAGFPDREACAAALAPIGEADGEDWLQREKERLDAYRHALKTTAEQIATLEQQTAGKVPVDLDALKEALAAAREKTAALAETVNGQTSLLQNHRDTHSRAAALRRELDRTANAARRIRRLAELALGASSDEGRLSFDRYVMGAVFREVLAMANQRLNLMTGGQFQLIHSIDAGRRNAAAGLEIEVLDVTKGKQRSSGSVSGGESFLVSLALALGLSDVVQAHAGGQRLDTLFIDEGFGSLDDGMLDNVIAVLQQLTEGQRLVGLISHVDKLEESIPQKLRVRRTALGSTLELELS